MKTNANSRYTVAVLIDGDNASFERMEDIMALFPVTGMPL